MCMCIPKFIIIITLNLFIVSYVCNNIEINLNNIEFYLITSSTCIYPLILYRFPYTFLTFLNIFLLYKKLDLMVFTDEFVNKYTNYITNYMFIT